MKAFTTGPFTGRHITMILVAFFGVVIAVNLVMAHYASSTFGGVVVENSYVASQEYNQWLHEAAQDGTPELVQALLAKGADVNAANKDGVTPLRLAATALRAIRDRNQLDTALVDDVVLGCVEPVGEHQHLARGHMGLDGLAVHARRRGLEVVVLARLDLPQQRRPQPRLCPCSLPRRWRPRSSRSSRRKRPDPASP